MNYPARITRRSRIGYPASVIRSAGKNAHVRRRSVANVVLKAVVIILSLLCFIPLAGILAYIIARGIGSVNWQFLISMPRPIGETGGGIANALTGTLLMVTVAAVIAVPLGIAAGLYLAENEGKKLARSAGLCVDILQGIPSIVTGIIIYFWIVRPMRTFSAFAGSAALAIMMLPLVARAAEETIKRLPSSLKEASLALGVPYHLTVLRVILPCGLSGILSGVLLAVARVAGETAPLLFTAFGNPYMNVNMLKPMQSLPLLIFNYATSPYDAWHNIAWGASLILLTWILILNIIIKLTTKRWRLNF
jgi:phosphate transport system permease protein